MAPVQYCLGGGAVKVRIMRNPAPLFVEARLLPLKSLLVAAALLCGCAPFQHKPIDWNSLYIEVPPTTTLPFPVSARVEYEGAGKAKRVEFTQTIFIGPVAQVLDRSHQFDEQALMMEYGEIAFKNIFAEVRTAANERADVICRMSAETTITGWNSTHEVDVKVAVRSDDDTDLGTYIGHGSVKSSVVFHEVALQNAYKLAFIDALEKIATGLQMTH